MFFIDDIILRSIGISIPPFDMIWLLEVIRDFTYKEMYDPEKIKDKIKENRMLYELGETSKEEYEKINDELVRQLKIAERVREMDIEKRIDILG